MPHFPQLSRTITVDVAIIGGGMAGVSAAYALTRAGKTVALCERETIGAGATARTTAFLTRSLDTDLRTLVRMYGKERTAAIIGSHQQAIEAIAKLVRAEQIQCEFTRCANSLYTRSPKGVKDLQEEARIARSVGWPGQFRRDGRLGFQNSGYLEFPRQAKFHPMKFLGGLAQRAVMRGARIYEHTSVRTILGSGPYVLVTPHGKIVADWVIVATHSPFNQPVGLYFKKAMYQSYVLEAHVPRGSLREGTYEDDENPYHYLRVDRGVKEDRVIFGGEDHRRDVKVKAGKNFTALKNHFQELMGTTRFRLHRDWRGPILESIDGLAYIGRWGETRLLYAFAFSGNGMTYAALSAMMFRDIIMKGKSVWEPLYSVNRIPGPKKLALKGRDYLGKFFGGAVKNTLTKPRKTFKRLKPA